MPRSRSTSMSLRAPPTSSSFFDLYEQLGIWPTPEKEKGAAGQEVQAIEKGGDQAYPTSLGVSSISQSPSASFSIRSWEATMSAFPTVENSKPTPHAAFDFGMPNVGDPEIMDAIYQSPKLDDAASEVLSNIAVAASSCDTSRQYALSSRTSTAETSGQPAQAASNVAGGKASGSQGMSRGPTGSGGSSRNSSRIRRSHSDKRRTVEGGLYGAAVSSSNSSSDSESDGDLDDVPLSQLHPQAVVAQQARREDAAKRKERRRAEKEKMRARKTNPKIVGRNPGAESNWDGEGGVPADVLQRKLERLLSVSPTGATTGSAEAGSTFRRSHAGQVPVGPASQGSHALGPQRSFTAPTDQVPISHDLQGQSVQRSQTGRRPGSAGRSQHRTPMQRPMSPVVPRSGPGSSAMLMQSAVSHAEHPVQRGPSVRQQASSSSHGPMSSHNPSANSSSHGHGHQAPALTPSVARSANVTRSITTATQHTSSTRQRERAPSSATSQSHGTDDGHARLRTEPVPARDRAALCATTFFGALDGKKGPLEVFPETTARDVLLASHQRGELSGLASGMSWVVVEVFAELGCGEWSEKGSVKRVDPVV